MIRVNEVECKVEMVKVESGRRFIEVADVLGGWEGAS